MNRILLFLLAIAFSTVGYASQSELEKVTSLYSSAVGAGAAFPDGQASLADVFRKAIEERIEAGIVDHEFSSLRFSDDGAEVLIMDDHPVDYQLVDSHHFALEDDGSRWIQTFRFVDRVTKDACYITIETEY